MRNYNLSGSWALTNNNRIGALVNAYYLGCLLEERASTPLERTTCRRILTKHYVLACTRVYNLYNIVGTKPGGFIEIVEYMNPQKT